MKLKTIDLTSTKSTQFDLPDELFSQSVNQTILANYLRTYLIRQRQYSASAKSRGEVTATTAKVWRQKGTGRARHGSRRAPIFVGGGKAHGPSGIRAALPKLSKQAKKIALTSALSSQAKNVQVVSSFEKLDTKAKAIQQTLTQKLGWNPTQKILFILHSSKLPQIKASQNLTNVSTTQAHRLNPYEIVNNDLLIFTQESIEILTQTFLPSPQKSDSKQVSKTKTAKPTPKTTKSANKSTTTKKITTKSTKPKTKSK